jgi:hypothetical protein
VLKAEAIGRIIKTATQKPFTCSEDCVGRNPHMAYSASSTPRNGRCREGVVEDSVQAADEVGFESNSAVDR